MKSVWELLTIDDVTVCFKNAESKAKVMVGRNGDDNIMIQVYDTDGKLCKDDIVRFRVNTSVSIEPSESAKKASAKQLTESRNRSPSFSSNRWRDSQTRRR